MALLKNGKLVDDLWTVLDDEENPFSVDHPLITLESWKQNEAEIIRHNKPIGIFLRSDQSPEKIGESMDRFSLVAIDFPVFTDGRGFSYARILREQLGYKGELRAVGDVRRDQYLYMLRCGFNAFEMKKDSDLEDWNDAAKEFSAFYQVTGDSTPWVLRRRHI